MSISENTQRSCKLAQSGGNSRACPLPGIVVAEIMSSEAICSLLGAATRDAEAQVYEWLSPGWSRDIRFVVFDAETVASPGSLSVAEGETDFSRIVHGYNGGRSKIVRFDEVESDDLLPERLRSHISGGQGLPEIALREMVQALADYLEVLYKQDLKVGNYSDWLKVRGEVRIEVLEIFRGWIKWSELAEGSSASSELLRAHDLVARESAQLVRSLKPSGGDYYRRMFDLLVEPFFDVPISSLKLRWGGEFAQGLAKLAEILAGEREEELALVFSEIATALLS